MCVPYAAQSTITYLVLKLLKPTGEVKVGQDSICCLLNGHTDVTQDTAETQLSPLVLTTKTISKVKFDGKWLSLKLM